MDFTSIFLFYVLDIQGGQNFFEPIRTTIRTFSEEIRSIRTIFFKKIRTIRTFFKPIRTFF